VRTRYRPLDRERPEAESRAATDKDHPDLAASSGSSAGMPRFLTQPAASTAIDEEAGEGGEVVAEEQPAALPEISGTGVEEQVTAFSVTLRGHTDAKFRSSFRTRDVHTAAATGCDNCTGAECVHATGTLESTFRVTTTVTLPSVSDFPDLTPCQRTRVQNAIDTVLAPHEQEHVVAFHTYDGVVNTPFDLTLCRTDFDARIQELHDSVESARQASAQALSDALDPFEFEVDLNCED
jgi:hypothetical protein